ncbi:YfiT family bacillithiol transferase [Hymenobacter psychrotolerans]|uniref:DinB superfamily protein n=1 Tax=Hymenobacter psychrotolerans DSM 18569 TaxID=1121959 RepID=A0A1M6V971_9BACT|nr:bacillithiol transferase BstA [Hymenobacter psychrotolerans]SHK77931.1 DinB superfamily protein [Hymenobacter psychrotolerans DSM 18569]
MTITTEPDLRYPIGHPVLPAHPLEQGARMAYIAQIALLPDQIRAAVTGLNPTQLNTPYRPGGWSVRQVLHHLPDSHLNSYTRFKLALTEENPVVRPYEEAAWAELPDSQATPPAVSLALLEALHIRWGVLMRHLTPEQWARTFHHPEKQRDYTLDQALVLYAWHGRHHLGHIAELRRREGWG